MASIKFIKTAAAISAVVVSFILYVLAFDPFGVAEFAYVFAVPAIWACRYFYSSNYSVIKKNQDDGYLQQAKKFGLDLSKLNKVDSSVKVISKSDLSKKKKLPKIWVLSVFLGSVFAWGAILIWLRHVYPPTGWIAVVLMALIIGGGFVFPWFYLLPRLLPPIEANNIFRIKALLGLAGAWVLLEWLRSWIFTGFPWLLLGHSQWTRPAVIQTAEFGGVWIVSFVLIFFNLAIAEYGYRIFKRQAFKIESKFEKVAPYSRFAPEFYLALILALLGVWIYILNIPRKQNEELAFRVAMVQTDFAGILKWDEKLAKDNLDTIRRLSDGAMVARPDIIIWPEAATPPRWPIIGVPEMRTLIENFSAKLNVPMLIGNMAYSHSQKSSQNSVFAISPKNGLDENYYSKSKLVPFGEYVPAWCKFIGKVVPVGDMKAGENFKPIDLQIKGKQYKIGSMICYEDIFPMLGVNAARNGAQLFFVCTNDSWYGREAGAWQHAAHSAFQAVSNRRPLMRSSNNGLSTVFDQYGRMRPTFTIKDKNGQTWNGNIYDTPAAELEILDKNGQKLDSKTLKPRRPTPMVDDNGSIYFRGAGFADLVFYKNFNLNNLTFYARYPNFVIFLSFCFLLLAFIAKYQKKA